MKAKNRWWIKEYPQDSPSEVIRKQLLNGDGNWPGALEVTRNLQIAAHKMAASGLLLSDEHITLCAIIGCGHEETMKYEQMRLRGRGLL